MFGKFWLLLMKNIINKMKILSKTIGELIDLAMQGFIFVGCSYLILGETKPAIGLGLICFFIFIQLKDINDKLDK